MRRRSGFSLAEVALGVAIVTALSGMVAAASHQVSKQTKINHLIDKAQEVLAAADRYMMDRGGFDYSMDPGLFHMRYLFWGTNPAATNPYQPLFYNGWVTSWGGAATTADGGYPNGFSNGQYPSASKGFIKYFYKGNRTWNTMLAYDGRTGVTYDYYAVQVTDDRGYPVFTAGR